jgi:adenylyltransferase/sulfurtransferase
VRRVCSSAFPRPPRGRKNPECPVCGANSTIKELIDYNQFYGVRGEEGEAKLSAKIPEIQPEELKRRLDAREDIFVLDVREPHEYQIVNIKGQLIPLGDLPTRVHELDSCREIVVHLQERRAQRQGRGLSAPVRLQACDEPDGWNLGMD